MPVYGKNINTFKWKPSNPEKYVGDPNDIWSRSSWETKFMKYCDSHPDIVEWGSEPFPIPYFDPVKNKQRRYFVDFWVKIKQKDGSFKKFLIEIKPDKFTRPPVQPKRKTKGYIEEQLQYVTNTAKWEAANKVCQDNGIQFLILTENHLGTGKK